MAGHSHWAGIKHKKGKADKIRSKIFSKLSREITVAAKLGDKDPDLNSRLRSAIQSARLANMPKDNIKRAIEKSDISSGVNYETIRYEGFGPFKVACIVETLTNNKNRTASNLRTIFQKNNGSLGTQGSASHNFNQLGVIRLGKNKFSESQIFDYCIEIEADDIIISDEFFEIHSKKNKIDNVKKQLEKKTGEILFTEIEWVPTNIIDLTDESKKEVNNFIDLLLDDDDVQKVYVNLK